MIEADPTTGQFAVRIPSQHLAAEGLAHTFERSPDATALKLGNPALWTPRQDLAKLLLRWELFKLQRDVQGSIVECGVGHGGGLLAWHHFSAIHEPVNHQRKVIGFDTFAGFPELAVEDARSTSPDAHTGGLAVDSYNQIMQTVQFHDANRTGGHINKLELVKGDATETIPRYLKENPHLLVSLLWLDFDIYEPTFVALGNFIPRMPKGAVLAFDEVNVSDWPGETLAMLQQLDPNSLELRRFYWASTTCYAVL